jgi:radical SAM superfamily enzyme YgiQ (UPF0313 family)
MRVLLINPPFYRLLGSHYNANSLGIAHIASVLNQHGHDAWLYNADYMDLDNYKNLKTIFGKFHDYTKYFENSNHDIWEEIVSNIQEFKPDWIGYTSYTANISAIDIISRKIKQRMPKVKQVIGGVHATLDINVLNSVPAIDYCVRREGEFPMLRLVNGENHKRIEGVQKRGDSISLVDSPVIKDIDELPLPERKNFWKVKDKLSVDVSYICSIRGCPYRCNYCASPFHWKRNATRYRSPESVIDELKLLKNNWWICHDDFSASANTKSKNELIIKDNTIVYFVDDIFTIKKKRAMDIMEGISDLDMPWKCEARADHLNKEICEMMAKSNCKRVKIGFETGSDRILKMVQKDETKSQMLHGANLLKDAGVPFTAYFMAGFPGETDDDLRETIKFAKEINADYYSLSVLSPYYGTKMYFDLVSEGYELEKQPWEYFYHQTGKLMANNNISPEVLQEYLSLNDKDKHGYV